jgi:flagellar basal-body rod protein FlgC
MLDLSASALTAERYRIQVIANNLANAQTTHSGRVDANGDPLPYRRRRVYFQSGDPAKGLEGEGISVKGWDEDPSAFDMKYEPSHPHAVRQGPQAGYVRYPNVRMIHEMTDMMVASRMYEANITAMETTRALFQSTLRLIA